MVFLKGTVCSASTHGPPPKGSSTGELSGGQRQEAFLDPVLWTHRYQPSRTGSSNSRGGQGADWRVVEGLETASKSRDTEPGAPTSGGAAVLFRAHSSQITAPSRKMQRLSRRYCHVLRGERKNRLCFVFLLINFLLSSPFFSYSGRMNSIWLFSVGVDEQGWNAKGKSPRPFF